MEPKSQIHRAFPRLLACLLLAQALPAFPAQTLKEMAAKAGLNIGSAVGGEFWGSSPLYRNVLASEFNIMVPENAMKFEPTEPNRNQFDFKNSDDLVAYALAHGMKMRGHNLVWYNTNPGWLTNTNFSRKEMLSILENHIKSLVGRYRGKILEWDVVNEAVDNGGLRNTIWKSRVGDDYIDSAFTYAHRADPDAFLYYNDYGAEGMNSKSDKVYGLVKRLKEHGIPVHGVGLQCHFGGVNKADIDKNMKRLGALGLRVSITELDIVNSTNNPKPWGDLMSTCLDNANCKSFLTWGIDDGSSWRGGGCGCLLFTSNFTAKPAHDALLNALANADPLISSQRRGSQSALFNGPASESIHYLFRQGSFRFTLLQPQNVSLRIFDTRGRLQATLADGPRATGDHSVAWNTHGVTPGVYIARLQSGDQLQWEKIRAGD